jgi:hypothetical protein
MLRLFMQEKKNKRLLILLVLLLVATVVTYFFLSRDEGETVDKRIFLVDDLQRIDKVVLKSRESETVLSFNGVKWVVNNQHEADRRMIEVLFATLKQEEPKRPAARSQNDSLSTALKENGVHVTLFQGESMKKDFFAGGNKLKTQAYFLEPGTGEVFLMNIPGYRVYVSGIYEIGESGFRDKYVFGFNWRNFKALHAEFPSNPKENFTVSMVRNFFTIEGMANADTAKVNTFLDQVSLLTVDQYLSTDSLIKSLDPKKASVKITVEDIAKRTYTMTVFPSRESETTPGLVGGDAVFFDSRKIRPILLPKSFFLKR